MSKSSSADRYRLRDAFTAVRAVLLDERYSSRLNRSLAYWALPADRRLPVALLDRSLHEIVQTPFDRLAATPGIGQKKLATLVVLLRRAADESSDAEGDVTQPPRLRATADVQVESPLDPNEVSEATWESWCSTIRAHDLGRERLGRLAPSLQDLPTVIWNKPLSLYAAHTLTEIRKLKTHGEKRIRVVLDVFRSVHQLLGATPHTAKLSVRLMPRFVPPLEEWFAEVCGRSGAIDLQEIRQNLALPILNQLEIDAGQLIQKLTEGRLGIEGPPESVRNLAKRIGVTRARVYQLLETVNRIMEVRWPEGRLRFAQLEPRMQCGRVDRAALAMFRSLRELCFTEGDIREEALTADELATEVAAEETVN